MRPAVEETFIPDAAGKSWHGSAPRLATADEFGSYSRLQVVTDFGYTAVRLLPSSVAVPSIDVTVQLSSPQGITSHDVYLNTWASGFFVAEYASATVSVDVPADTWTSHTFRLVAGVDYDQAEVEAALATGTLHVLADAGRAVSDPTPAANLLHYSQLLVEFGGVTYLRNHARDDGLGGNAPRNYPRTSQQRSLRNKGYR